MNQHNLKKNNKQTYYLYDYFFFQKPNIKSMINHLTLSVGPKHARTDCHRMLSNEKSTNLNIIRETRLTTVISKALKKSSNITGL